MAEEQEKTVEEVEEERRKLKVGRSAGKDGIPTEVVKNLPCLVNVVVLLFV